MGDVAVDVYQPFRMTWLWTTFAAVVAFETVRLLVRLADAPFTRWQAILASVAGLMAGVVMASLKRQWTGSATDWLWFTIGFGYAVAVLLASALLAMLAAGRNDEG